MQRSLNIKASKEDYKGGMQYMAQRHEPIMDRAQLGINKDQNMLRWGLTDLGKMAYKLGHKQGNNAQPLEALKGWKKWEHDNPICSKMSC